MLYTFIPFLAQVSVDGLEKASETSVVAGVLASLVLILFGLLVYVFKLYEKKGKEVTEAKEKQVELMKDHQEELDEIRKEVQKRDDDRLDKSLASEKEMVNVLNGVNSIMSLSDRMSQKDNKLILEKLNEILKKLE